MAEDAKRVLSSRSKHKCNSRFTLQHHVHVSDVTDKCLPVNHVTDKSLYLVVFVGRKLFGDGYSGLEYDYRGLLRLYNAKGNTQKAAEYSSILHEWNVLRDRIHVQYDGPVQLSADTDSCDEVVTTFFSTPQRSDAAACQLFS